MGLGITSPVNAQSRQVQRVKEKWPRFLLRKSLNFFSNQRQKVSRKPIHPGNPGLLELVDAPCLAHAYHPCTCSVSVLQFPDEEASLRRNARAHKHSGSTPCGSGVA